MKIKVIVIKAMVLGKTERQISNICAVLCIIRKRNEYANDGVQVYIALYVI